MNHIHCNRLFAGKERVYTRVRLGNCIDVVQVITADDVKCIGRVLVPFSLQDFLTLSFQVEKNIL